jgi:glycosyltransferase involved in cell wall biosynthesis
MISVEKEENRSWKVEHSGLNIIKQKTITLKSKHKISNDLTDISYIHIPYDTIYRLCKLHPKIIITAEFGFRTISAVLYKKLFSRSDSCVFLYADLAESTEHYRGKLKTWLRKWLIRKSDYIITNGRSGERYLLKLGAEKSKILKIPYAIDEQFLQRKLTHNNEAQNICKLLYVGRLIELKGLIPFLQSLIAWANQNTQIMIEWTLAGDGELKMTLENMQLPDNLTLNILGNIPYNSLKAIYADADIFVLPTYEDTWGLVVNEAMASSLPVLGSLYSQAVEEMVEEGKNGWTFHPDKTDEMYDAINRAMMDFQRGNLIDMGKTAYQKAVMLSPTYVANLMLTAFAMCTEKP